MEEATVQKPSATKKLVFSHFPAFAHFVRKHHLIEYIAEQLKGARELDTPLLKVFGDMSDEQLIEYSIPSHTEFLIAAEENRLYDLLQTSMNRWISDQLEVVGRDQIQAEDNTQVSYLRKKALHRFLPFYTDDLHLILQLIEEIDQYQLESDTVATNTYIRILQDRVRKSEDLYRQAEALSHIGNWTLDLKNNKLSWSEELYRIYNLDPSTEITYDLLFSLNHPDDAPKVAQQMDEVLKNQKSLDFYYRAITSDGKLKVLHALGELVLENDSPVRVIGTLQDVTERQNLIDKLQQSDFLYKQAQALSHIGNWTWDIHSNTITWTDELYRIFDYEPGEEITFEKYLARVHPQDISLLQFHLDQAMQTHQPYDFYHRIILRDGTERIIQSRGEVLLDQQGKPYQFMGTGQDVTRQQKIEQELRANKEFINKIANTTPSLIASYNVHTGKYTFINHAVKKILGYDTEEILENGVAFFSQIIHPEDQGPLMEKNNKALEEANLNPPSPDGQEPVVEFKYRMRHKTGKWLWFHTFGTIFDRNEKGLVEHMLNVSIDITEQEEAEQELHRKNIQLLQSNASLEEYAYVASHDLKEPIRKIATFSDRLLSTHAANLSPDGKTYLEKIKSSAQRMQLMISDLLALSVISGNKAFEYYSLDKVVKEVLQTLEYKIEELEARIQYDPLPSARIIPAQFRQLFQNLLSNSLKFIREGVRPEINISCSYLRPEQVQDLEISQAKRYLCLEISDNGIGFDNQFANKIFTIFQRLHGKAEYEGTGIGLAICKKIAENHGGTIIALGNLKQGSKFTIIIPV